MKKQSAWLCLAMLPGLTACTTMQAQIKSSGSMGQVDADYANTTYQLIQLNKQAGTLAQTKATDPRVQALAARLVAQTDAFSPGLQSALEASGVKPSATLPPDEAAQIDTLKKASGPAFDHQFVDAELAVHERAVNVLTREVAETKDGALRTQASTEISAVQGNLATLQILSKEYKGKS